MIKYQGEFNHEEIYWKLYRSDCLHDKIFNGCNPAIMCYKYIMQKTGSFSIAWHSRKLIYQCLFQGQS